MSRDFTTRYGIDIEKNDIGIYRRKHKFVKDEKNRKTVKFLYFCKANEIINKPKNGLKWHDEIKELPPN